MKLLSLLACTALFAACSSTKNSAPPMSEAEMMAAMEAANAPGAEHKALDPLVGTFTAKAKSRMSAESPWTDGTGTCENRWIFGGRFIEMNFRGTFDKKPFEGRGALGYDNMGKHYVGSWFDSMYTGLMPNSAGLANAGGNVLTLSREMTDPMSGDSMKMREVWTIDSRNKHRLESYCQSGDADEFLMMTIDFTR